MINELTPALFLLVGALFIFGGARVARYAGVAEAIGSGVGLCLIAIGVVFAPASWRDGWAGGIKGDRLLTYARLVGLSGMFFLAGTKFDFDRLRDKTSAILSFAVAAAALLAGVMLLVRLLGSSEWGPNILIAATVVASSLWLPSIQSSHDGNRRINYRVASQTFAFIAMLAVYFYDTLAVVRSRQSLSVYAIVTLYEAVKLLVLFGFGYFIVTRFLAKADGRISTTRTAIGFALIASLIFVLAATASNQLAAIGWAFVAGALFSSSNIGKLFREGQRSVASAVLVSLVFLPLLLQSHGRVVTAFLPISIGIVAALIGKALVVLFAARASGLSWRQSMLDAVTLLGAGELAILFLGFGLTRWSISPPVYFGILTYALASTLLTPVAALLVTTRTVGSVRQKKRELKEVSYVSGRR